MSVNELIPLEDMKAIAKRCVEKAETLLDFYTSLIEEVYKLGVQHGKGYVREGEKDDIFKKD